MENVYAAAGLVSGPYPSAACHWRQPHRSSALDGYEYLRLFGRVRVVQWGL
jgi:hypothetical protein